ncbi:MAG TPA: hypothetical protein VLA66_03650 [Thermoanaerobaculia bacterium]|nr:hypothetical protein [Thermoanaerobaculia bacterium]
MSRSDRRPPLTVVSLLALLAPLALAGAPAAAQRVAFVTSATGTGDLGYWPQAGGQVGAAAGDEICQALASAAGLANPGNFVAWLSDASDDAYCRVHGLSGTRAGNCGEPSLPAAAGPWVRTDGMPFAGPVQQLTTAGLVYLPLLLDEHGVDIAPLPDASTRTATTSDGTLYPADAACADWTSSAIGSFTANGTPSQTTDGWTNAGQISCAGGQRLVCLERVAGPPLPAPAVKLRRAFLTSASGHGELASWPAADPGTSGVAAGDSICRNLAQAAGWAEASSFKAWLSTASTAAPDRFANDGPWVTADNVVVAWSVADLTDGVLETSIHVTEQGQHLGNYGVWTGTQDDGLARPERCAEWTSASGGDQGASGASDRTRFGWSWSFGAAACDATYLHLYCLSDAAGPFFADGFDWGTTTAWSSVQSPP